MSAYIIKITREVIEEYKKRLSEIKIINDDIKKKYLKYLDEAIREKNRSRFFEIMSFIEEWTQREPIVLKKFKGEKHESKKSSKQKRRK